MPVTTPFYNLNGVVCYTFDLAIRAKYNELKQPNEMFYGTIWCRGKSMVSIKDRKILRQMFSHYDYVMTTAQLSKEKLYYRDIQRMLKAGLIEKSSVAIIIGLWGLAKAMW